MARPVKNPLFLRNGVYYARILGNRWSTETANPIEALKRLQFMKMKGKPWSDIKNEFGAQLVIKIDTEGQTSAKLIEYEVDSKAETPTEIDASIVKKISYPKGDPHVAWKIAKGEPLNNSVVEEPPKDCKDLVRLLDYEYHLKVLAGKCEGTLEYYFDRFASLKRFIRKHSLDLSTFSKARALEYPVYRLKEPPANRGELGFNNRPAQRPTINKEIALFKNLWSTWREEGRITENTWARVDPLKEEFDDDVSEDEEQIYTLEEVQAILRNVDSEIIRDILFFQAIIGCRPGLEVLLLTRDMIDRGKIYNFKKRRRDNFTYSPQAMKFFIEFLEGKMDGLSSHIIHQEFVKACERAGVRVGKPYDLRKVFGTEALSNFKIETVQALLRHKNLNTTRKFYAKTRKPESSAAANKMQRKIFKKLSVA
jgi:integrase